MHRLLSLSLLLTVVVVGCGVQRGRFTTSGEDLRVLSSHPGCIDIVYGQAGERFNENSRPLQNLIYLLVVCPDIQVQGSGSSSDYGRYVTRITYTWDTRAGTISVPLLWDREADTVAISGQTYGRDKGNVFVVRRESNGRLAGQQLASLGPHAQFAEVLQHVRQQLTNDELIASLRLEDAK